LFTNQNQVYEAYQVFCWCLLGFTQVGLYLGTKTRSPRVLIATICLVPGSLAVVGIYAAISYRSFQEQTSGFTVATGVIAEATALTVIALCIMSMCWWTNTTRVLSGMEPDESRVVDRM
jgi:hypothetical protein